MPARVARLQAALAEGLGALAQVVPVETCGGVAVIDTKLSASGFEQLRRALRPAIEFQRDYGARIYIGAMCCGMVAECLRVAAAFGRERRTNPYVRGR